jgi:predicted DNA-binding transcriptional regulator AlpA
VQNIVDRPDLRKVLNRRQAGEMAGVSEDTIARMEKLGKFPSSIRLSPRRVGYRLVDVEAWLAAAA